jgi:hypothetical protein
VGLATVGGSTAVAGVLGTAATWVASTGNRAAGRETQTPRLVGACERHIRGLGGGGASCAAWPVVTAPPQKKKTTKTFGEQPNDASFRMDIKRKTICIAWNCTFRQKVLRAKVPKQPYRSQPVFP